MVMKKMNTAQGTGKLNADDATKAKIDEISKDGIPFLDRKFLKNHKQRMDNLKNDTKLF
jgi:hypothetical protein